MGGRIVSLAIFPGRELVLMLLGEYLPNAPSLPLGARLSTSYPLRLVGGGLPQTPLEPTREQQGVWLCVKPRDLRGVEECLTLTLLGGLGVYPLKNKGTALCIKTLIFLPCANSIDFLWVSYRLSINFL